MTEDKYDHRDFAFQRDHDECPEDIIRGILFLRLYRATIKMEEQKRRLGQPSTGTNSYLRKTVSEWEVQIKQGHKSMLKRFCELGKIYN